MNSSKKINVNFSSLVGLKAELLRKHAEVQNAKATMDNTKPNVPKVKVRSKKVKVKEEKDEKFKGAIEIEDINELRKSKYMLEAKSRLYDKLKKSHGDTDHQYLVDFQKKSDESEDEFFREEDYEDKNSDPEDDWINYEDCFGRTRKCLRRDLPKMKEKDNLIKKEITKEPPQEETEDSPPQPAFIPPEKEPEIEIMRRKWEEQTERLTHKSDIHYQDILFDEARTHGVGYYAFSQDEEERAKQQANLAKLRKETEQRQKELQEINDLKSKMEENRLKAARIRLRIRAGLPAEPTDEEAPEKIEIIPTSEKIEPTAPTESANDAKTTQPHEKNSLMLIEDKIKAFGELLGKRPQWRELSQEEWVHKRRKDRHGEFAPVYDNFKSAGLLATKDNQLSRREDDDDDPLRLRSNGPEPTDMWESTGPAYRDGDESLKEPNNANAIPTSESNQLNPLESEVLKPNFAEPPPFIHPVPPPSFISSIPPPSTLLTPSFIDSGLLPSLYNSSFVGVNSLQTTPAALSAAKIPQEKSKESNSESDSDDSDIIGPMPPPAMINNEALSEIPLPNIPPPDKTQTSSSDSNTDTEKKPTNLNIDKITAGLKYLREKFDKNPHDS